MSSRKYPSESKTHLRFKQKIEQRQHQPFVFKLIAFLLLITLIYLSYDLLYVPMPTIPIDQTQTKAQTETQTEAQDQNQSTSDSSLVWWLKTSKLRSTDEIKACLWQLGEKVDLLGEGEELLIHRQGQRYPQMISKQKDQYWLKTYLGNDLHANLSAHLYLVICLKTEDAQLINPINMRTFEGDRWPSLGPNGGVNLNDIIEFEQNPCPTQSDQICYFSKGLKSLKIKEIYLPLKTKLESTSNTELQDSQVLQIVQNLAVQLIVKPLQSTFFIKIDSYEFEIELSVISDLQAIQIKSIHQLQEQESTSHLKAKPKTKSPQNLHHPKLKPKSDDQKAKGSLKSPIEIPVFKPEYR
jgi:hypothetical protein